MSIENMKVTWLTDDTIRACATFRDYEEELTDPPTQLITYYDPEGLAHGTASHGTMNPGSISLGHWCNDFPIPAAGPTGDWKLSWRVTYTAGGGTFPVREIAHFKVADP
ncbi:unnamed protein product [marine sediment metagenome]|uniref:Next to BRCA1 central domain-containing protein n=1 Tax=marine sediment metagenome TaxID=412755 RepID=X1I952_9ZZZZ